MADNTVTLVLDGRVPLESFVKGVVGFGELVAALTEKVSSSPLSWTLDDLQYSSALATVKAEGDNLDIGNVVAAYEDVGDALESRRPLRYGRRVDAAAAKLYNIGVERVRLETARRESIVRTSPEDAPMSVGAIRLAPQPSLQSVRARRAAFGGIKGRIQTLTNRGGLRFTLFDLHHDKAVSCYFADGKQDIVRDLWGRLAIVEGMITRDPVNGRPLSIRGVSEITPLPEPTTRRDFEYALGAAPSLSGMSSEEAIRRVRDAQ